ncbi:universal stress protein [Georgenia sp. Z1344]|uniref:universal stress protein n=1 Tax=Georgenia sp. Z1344 TaxID=3416706 RepID=UPI003CEAC649
MHVVVAYLATPEGEAALSEAIAAATERDERVVVVLTRARTEVDTQTVVEVDADAARARLDEADLAYEIRYVGLGRDAGHEIVQAAVDTQARLVVLGLTRRAPTGTLSLGSGAQHVLLESPCPVLVVHP